MTKHGRTDDRINIGGARFFSGKIEAVLDELPMVKKSAVIRVFTDDGAEAIGIVVEPEANFESTYLKRILANGINFVGERILRTTESLPIDTQVDPDREAIKNLWDKLAS